MQGEGNPPVPGVVNIGGRPVGPGLPVYIVAEMSANHGNDFNRAAAVIRAAADAGADAVKLQTYTADTLTLPVDTEPFLIRGTLWDGRTLHDLYSEASMPWEWQPRLKAVAEECGLQLFSSPFDATAVDFLEAMDVPCHKIASFELVDIPLIKRVAATGKPVIMSTGMATLAEIEEAVHAFRDAGGRGLILLKCTSAYPAPPEEANLRTIAHLSRTFDAPAGLSDHTVGVAVPVAAVGLGACLIEKHFTLSRDDGGPDSAFSLEPEEFRTMVEAVRTAESAMGRVAYGPTEKQRTGLAFRRSLFVARDVRAGEVFTEDNLRSVRPSDGLHPRHHGECIGRRAARDAAAGTPVTWDLLEEEA